MKRTILAFCLTIPLLAGCGHRATTRVRELDPTVDHIDQPLEVQAPTTTTAAPTTTTTENPKLLVAGYHYPSTTAPVPTTVYTGDRCQSSDPGVTDCGTTAADARGYRNPNNGSCVVTDPAEAANTQGLVPDDTCPVNR